MRDLLLCAKHLFVEANCTCGPTPSGSIRTARRRTATRRRARLRWRQLKELRAGVGTMLGGQDKTSAHTRTDEPNPPRSTVCPRPVRALAGRRTSVRSCSGVFLPSLLGTSKGRAEDRGHHRPQAGEVGMWPCFQAPAQMGIVRGRFPGRQIPRAERSRQQSESCRRPAPQRDSDQQVKHSRWTHRKRRGRLCNAVSSLPPLAFCERPFQVRDCPTINVG